jgi:hypothetical protein
MSDDTDDRVTVIHETSNEAVEGDDFTLHGDATSVTISDPGAVPINPGDTYFVVIGDSSMTMDLKRRMTDMNMDTVLRFEP